jgi:D-hexose-6-phosphate mutarotase
MNLNQPLKKYFSIDNHVTFKKLDNGIVLVKIDNSLATATISLYGGQVLEWQPKSQTKPVLWCSELVQFKPGKAIRAGVPVCWPWFGSHPEEPKAPAHGYARIKTWDVTSVSTAATGETLIAMRLSYSDEVDKQFSIHADLTIEITIGEALSISLTTRNTGQDSIALTEALHAYFHVSDIQQVQINGLDQTSYIDLIDHNSVKTQSGAIDFSAELGQVYLDTTTDCLIHDHALSRIIRVSKSGSYSTVVWNPWIDTATKMDDLGPEGWRTMVCVESANALNNVVVIEPDEQHTLGVRYSVEPY